MFFKLYSGVGGGEGRLDFRRLRINKRCGGGVAGGRFSW